MPKFQCPDCGEQFWSLAGQAEPPPPVPIRGGWHEVKRTRMHSGAGVLPVDTFSEYTREEPVRPPDVMADYLVPLLQALACGVTAGLLAAVVAHYAGWDLYAVLAVAVVAFAASWWWLLRHTLDSTVVREHVRTEPEQTQPGRQVTRLVVNVGDVHQERELAIAPDKLLAIAKGVVNAERSFSEREWSGRGRLLSGRAEYELVRDFFLDIGWARWKDEGNRKLGLEWTPAGTAALKALASGRVKAERLL